MYSILVLYVYDAAEQGVYSTRSHYQGQALDSLESSANNENKAQPQEQDMEIGYEDSPSPLTFEGLERIFLDKVKKLVKEQSDEEDIEIARHKEVSMFSINSFLLMDCFLFPEIGALVYLCVICKW